MLYLLDENIAKAAAEETHAYTAQRSIQVEGLGREAPDRDIHRFALLGGFVLVTKDGDDFEAIMRETGEPIPMVNFAGDARPAFQRRALLAMAPIVEAELKANPVRQFAVSADGTMTSYDLAM